MSLDIKRLLVPERNEMSFDVKERLTAAHKKEKLSAVNLIEPETFLSSHANYKRKMNRHAIPGRLKKARCKMSASNS